MKLTTKAMRDGWKAQDDEVADKLGWMQLMDSDLLVAAAKGDLDLNEVARWVLASRGIGESGRWVGFDEAKRQMAVLSDATAGAETSGRSGEIRRRRRARWN